MDGYQSIDRGPGGMSIVPTVSRKAHVENPEFHRTHDFRPGVRLKESGRERATELF